jgi:hypothetical protein
MARCLDKESIFQGSIPFTPYISWLVMESVTSAVLNVKGDLPLATAS